MAKQVQHKSSKLPEGVVPGCWWGIFHSDILQSLHLRKLLGQWRRADRSHAMGIKVSKAKMYLPLAADEDYDTEAENNITPQVKPMKDSANKDSGKSQRRPVVGWEISKQKGMGKQKGRKQKVNPYANQVLRTISIHHMECDDYVCPSEKPDDSNVQQAPILSQNPGSFACNKHTTLSPRTASEVEQGKRCEVCGILSGAGKYLGHKQLDVLGHRLVENQVLLREKIREVKNKMLEHQTVDGKGAQGEVALDHSKEFLETLELFNANRELLLKILHEQSATIANYLQGKEGSRTGRVLSKSGSYPGPGFSGRTADPFELTHGKDETAPLTKRERQFNSESSQDFSTTDSTEADKSQDKVITLKSVSNIHGVYETAFNSEGSSSFTPVMTSQKDNGTAVYRFKDIKQRIKDIIKENNKERYRISMDGILHKIPYGCNVSQEKLTPWAGPVGGDGSRKSFANGGASLAYRNANGHIRRSRSLTESLDRYSCLVESNFSREPKRQTSGRLNLVPEDSGFQVTNSRKAFGRMLSLPEFDSFFLGKDDRSESSRDLIHSRSISIDHAEGNAVTHTNGTDEQRMSDIFESSLEHTKEIDASQTNGDPDRCPLGNITYAASDDLETEKIASAHLNEEVILSHEEWSDKPAKPSPISVLNSNFPEDLVSTAEFSVLPASSELKSGQIHYEDLESFDSPQDQSDINDSSMVKTDASDINELQNLGIHSDFDTLSAPVDNVNEFHFVRDMLKKYLFHGDEHSATWNPPGHQLSSFISEEAEGSACELEPCSKDSNINLDHELLFDLINEALLEIEKSYVHCPWLRHACSRIRPTPVGYHVLEEVWANISWHLKSQPQANPSLEFIISQDFKKNDQWMNLHCDMENMELDLEVLIFDDLLDEVIIQCLDSACQRLSSF